MKRLTLVMAIAWKTMTVYPHQRPHVDPMSNLCKLKLWCLVALSDLFHYRQAVVCMWRYTGIELKYVELENNLFHKYKQFHKNKLIYKKSLWPKPFVDKT